MRQWELIGITDQAEQPRQPSPRPSIRSKAEAPSFFWSTDSALRMESVSEAAAQVIGRPVARCVGRDLLELFGLEGPNSEALDAHITALGGDTGTFILERSGVRVRCLVEPLRTNGRTTGTCCIAARIEDVDARRRADRSAVA
jgi:PAS domain-containing protein